MIGIALISILLCFFFMSTFVAKETKNATKKAENPNQALDK